MPRYDLELVSQEYGGVTKLTVKGGKWTLNSNYQLVLNREPGGSGAGEVKIGSVSLSPDTVLVARNHGDGTHFRMQFGIETDHREVSITIENSQGGGGTAASFVRVARPGVDSIQNQSAGAITENLRLAALAAAPD